MDEVDLMVELNNDQKRILMALSTPDKYFHGEGIENLPRGMTYQQLMEATELSLEKTLLSLGWLEALGLVKHEVGFLQHVLQFPGSKHGIPLASQEVTRIFYLTKKGKEMVSQLIAMDVNEENTPTEDVKTY